MKATQLLLLTATTALSTASAFGFAQFARGEALLSTTARALYDSRVFGGANGGDDYVFTLEPRLIYRREAGQLKLDSSLGARVNRYVEFNELDSEDFLASLRLRLPPEGSTVASGAFETSYDEHTDVNYDVNARVREKTFLSRANALIPTGLKTSVVLAGGFRSDQRNQFSDREAWDGSAGFRYGDFLGGSAFELSYRRLEVESTGGNPWAIPLDQQSDLYSATFTRPLYHDVRASLSYGYRVLHRSRAEVAGTENRSSGSIISVRLDGPFLPESIFPKIESSLMLGYQEAETPGINDRGGSRFIGAASVAWHARERTRLFLQARRSLELSINDLTVETTILEVGATQSIGNFLQTSASVGHEERDYRSVGRSDRAFTASLGATYRITKAWSAQAHYRVRASESDATFADYARHVAYVSANYTF